MGRLHRVQGRCRPGPAQGVGKVDGRLSDVRGFRRVDGGAARPRRDDRWCLIILVVGGRAAMSSSATTAPLAPTPEGGPSGRGRPAGPAGRAPAPWSRPGAWPWWASWRGAALWRRCASTSPTWVPVGPGALGLEVGRALPSPVHDQTGAPAGGPGRPRRACIGLDAHQGGRIGGRRVIAVEDETMRAARGEGDRAPHLLAAPGAGPAESSWEGGGCRMSPTRSPP